jgi:hypothetical protein
VYHTNQYLGNPALTFTDSRLDIGSVSSIPATGLHSFFAIVALSSTTADQNIIGDSGLNWRYGTSSGGSTRYQSVWDGGFGQGPIATAAIDTAWHKPILTYATSGAGGVHFYLDGAADPPSGGTFGSFGYNPPAWLCGTSITGEFLNGQVLLIGYWNRLLTPGEIAALTKITGPADVYMFVMT